MVTVMYLLRTYSMPDTILSALHELNHLILTTVR